MKLLALLNGCGFSEKVIKKINKFIVGLMVEGIRDPTGEN